MLKIYFIGICILIIAIIANSVIINVGLKSWYDFMNLLSEHGAQAFSKLKILDYIWLFFAYPLILGLGYLIGSKCYHWFFS
jgi:hypothetical protein